MALDALTDSPAENTPTDAVGRLETLFAAQFAQSRANPDVSHEIRQTRLATLESLVAYHENDLIAAINADFGNRARIETLAAEVNTVLMAIRHCRKNLKHWMRPRHVSTPLWLKPGRSAIHPQPLGVVGIIAPWNYPFQLAVCPLASALAAGNHVLIKPSEFTPQTSALLKRMIAGGFDPADCAVIEGDASVGEAFSALPFDHLLFTGSTAVGRKIYEAAAKNLTPVTLELGGKSPAIIDLSVNDDGFAGIAAKIAYGKLFNAGQTCIAPDYVLAPADKIEAITTQIKQAIETLFPDATASDDYTAIISKRHAIRLNNLRDRASRDGSQVITVGETIVCNDHEKIAPTLIINPPSDSPVMEEEIFGPLLPILPYTDLDEAITRINQGDRPLALYWFGSDDSHCARIISETHAGGMTVNDTLLHFAQENLPFGGVGASGIGQLHGQAGFDRFSHLKPVFRQSRLSQSDRLFPPYTDTTEKLLRTLRTLF